MSSGILQTAALIHMADYRHQTLTAEQNEAQRLFFSGVMGLTSTGLNVMKMGIT